MNGVAQDESLRGTDAKQGRLINKSMSRWSLPTLNITQSWLGPRGRVRRFPYQRR